MNATRYTADGRRLFNNEYEFFMDGKMRYCYRKMIDGKSYCVSSLSLEEMREKSSKLLGQLTDVTEKLKNSTKQNGVEIFKSDDFGDIRVVYRDGDPWFLAADVCRALDIGNPTMALTRLDTDEKALSNIEGLSRGNDKGNIVSEAGLYSLILRSRKPEAKAFKRWVTHEVIPSIRKHGVYASDEFLKKSEEERKKILEKIKNERDALAFENERQATHISELEEGCDMFGTISFTQLRDAYGESVIPMLKESGVIAEGDDGFLCLTEPYKNKGYAKRGKMKNGKPFMLWTALGCVDVVYKILKEKYGMIPVKPLRFHYV